MTICHCNCHFIMFLQSSRCFSTANLPLVLHSLEGRYATALYTASTKKNNLDTSATEMDSLNEYIASSPKITQHLQDPTLSRDAKKAIFAPFLAKLSQGSMLPRFISVISENGRLPLLSRILSAFSALLRAHHHQIDVTITSATPLPSKLFSTLTTILSRQFVPENHKPTFVAKIDPSILGGLVIGFGEKTIDLSVASRLASSIRSLETEQ
ncbi:unnamed protein product [Sphagnum compactum]